MSDLKPFTQRVLVDTIAKHLPPSGSQLRLWDIGGKVAGLITQGRADLTVTTMDTLPPDGENLVDSVVALNYPDALSASFLAAAWRVLRPGGRLIMIDTDAQPDAAIVQQLEAAGHTRILVEPAAERPKPLGVLMRGEKPHTTNSTFARIKVATDAPAANLTLATFDGPYVYALIYQAPNKPVWALRPDETLTWDAVLATTDQPYIVAFSSLPNAVSLMQTAVMNNRISGINKVGKFRRVIAAAWDHPLWLNPTLNELRSAELGRYPLDPSTAEIPDEA